MILSDKKSAYGNWLTTDANDDYISIMTDLFPHIKYVILFRSSIHVHVQLLYDTTWAALIFLIFVQILK